jgi:hypothetical protein
VLAHATLRHKAGHEAEVAAQIARDERARLGVEELDLLQPAPPLGRHLIELAAPFGLRHARKQAIELLLTPDGCGRLSDDSARSGFDGGDRQDALPAPPPGRSRFAPAMRLSRHAKNEMRLYGVSADDVQAAIINPAGRELDERGNARLIGETGRRPSYPCRGCRR